MNRLPSVDLLIRQPGLAALAGEHGHNLVVGAARAVLERHRSGGEAVPSLDMLAEQAAAEARGRTATALQRVYNLTGTVLHTNLGRAQLAEAAIDHAAMAMREACALEFDLATGGRGDRDTIVEGLICELTGAEAATVVNNNAAAVLLVLAALAGRREVVVSRGELVEIGGAFRVPDVMRAANVKLVEVGTTNRTHARDFEAAIGPKTAALMKVHASNYRIEGFTKAVAQSEVAAIAHAHGLPFIEDLGAGSLIDLVALGLPAEPVVRDCIAAGVDVVTFSGDKLLGGPQAGLIAGRKDLIAKIKKHPLKRALRVSKMTLGALEATLLAYRKPDLLTRDLPTYRLLTRPEGEIAALAERMAPLVGAALGTGWHVTVTPVGSQVGSGSLPEEVIASHAVCIAPAGKGSGKALAALADRLRALPVPVIGRVAGGSLLLDMRCLEDEAGFSAQLELLK
ncbi:L-seryl-tRNA(Sec) selenium transferase [Novosphingobium flavum]|uniref:L-seryl-tRNA(Sec) selenium transferase n=1 Tax=Novosphingobium flavum TaxID=1778672 RepID=A0A7X1FV90_9SPHN|nr:L-seryl-tRNA(Sec) selenium transferase [Novosphingobium flavum]MBC2667479.1 L-seryl-tRNA(Sec) selenium transferase [Novosphingobium flavum]